MEDVVGAGRGVERHSIARGGYHTLVSAVASIVPAASGAAPSTPPNLTGVASTQAAGASSGLRTSHTDHHSQIGTASQQAPWPPTQSLAASGLGAAGTQPAASDAARAASQDGAAGAASARGQTAARVSSPVPDSEPAPSAPPPRVPGQEQDGEPAPPAGAFKLLAAGMRLAAEKGLTRVLHIHVPGKARPSNWTQHVQ